MTPYANAHFTVHYKSVDLTTAPEIHATFFQDGCEKLDITDVTVQSDGEDGCYVQISLTQEQTSVFENNKAVKLQINWLNANGERPEPAPPATIRVGSQLMRRLLGVSQQEGANGS